jgi:opacity protein-like surface antigen
MGPTRHFAAAFALAAILLPVHAEPVEPWWYEATPYLHAAGLKGTLGARGVTTHADISFSDVLSDLDLALQGTLVAHKGPLSLGLDVEYIDLSDDASRSVTGPGGRASVLGKLDATSKLSIVQGTAGYRVLDERTKVDLLGGFRATQLDADLDLRGTLSVGDEVFGRSRSLGGSETWVDAIVGARVFHPVSEKVTLMGYVDVGGGGSDFTWQALAGVDWEFAKGRTLRLGYRELSWDYSHGGIVWDMKMHGPYAGLGFRF